jgi:CheY-like chemotaxis protein
MSHSTTAARNSVRVSTSRPAPRTAPAPLALLASSDGAVRDAREQQLDAAGFRVSLARTGFEAIVKASCQLPDVILLDESLGELEAIETARLLTTCPVTAHIPVIPLAAGRPVPRRLLTSLRRRPVV